MAVYWLLIGPDRATNNALKIADDPKVVCRLSNKNKDNITRIIITVRIYRLSNIFNCGLLTFHYKSKIPTAKRTPTGLTENTLIR